MATAIEAVGVESKYEREHAAFCRLFPSLLQTHAGQFVAIHDGQVVASGADRLQVVDEGLAKAGNVDKHVGYVGAEPMPIARSGVFRVTIGPL